MDQDYRGRLFMMGGMMLVYILKCVWNRSVKPLFGGVLVIPLFINLLVQPKYPILVILYGVLS